MAGASERCAGLVVRRGFIPICLFLIGYQSGLPSPPTDGLATALNGSSPPFHYLVLSGWPVKQTGAGRQRNEDGSRTVGADAPDA